MKKRHKAESVLLIAMTLFASFEAFAANTFTAVSGSDWNTADNWSEGVPLAGQEVVINGNATLTNATPTLASLTVNSGKTLTFDGWDTLLSATTVTIAGTVTHAQNTATATNSLGVWVPNARVNIACSNLTVASTGAIDVKGKGYLGGVEIKEDGKTVVCQRFKQPGMFWSPKSTKPLLPLRALLKSNRLCEYSNFLVKGLPQVDIQSKPA